MDRGTEHERPAKRAKRDKEEGSPPIGHADDGSDTEGPGSIADSGAAHGSDLYLDTVRDTPSICSRNLKPSSGQSRCSRL
jgi:hypothetical protein